MRVKEVSVEVGLTLSPRQYESVKVHSTVTIELDAGDVPLMALQGAAQLARKQCEAEAADIIEKNWGSKK